MKQMYTAFSKPISFFLFFLLCLSTGIGQTTNPSTGQFIVKYSADIPAEIKASLRQEIGVEKLTVLPSQRLEIWKPISKPGREKQKAILRALQDFAQKRAEIAYIEPDYIFSAEATPNDPLFDSQWGLNNYGQTGGQAGADIQALNQWGQSTGSDAIVAGILDTGIDWGHEDLAENIWQNLAEDFDGDGHTIELDNGTWVLDPGDLNGTDDDGNGYVDDLIGWDFVNNDNNPFDDNGHGTHVAGIAGARGNNGKGIAGVSWQTPLMALKAFDAKGSGSVLSILPALEYARQMGVQVINNSWGGPAFSQVLYDEMQLADNDGILNIAAAGNQAANNSNVPIYPGSFDLSNVICVAATNHHDSLAVFSNFSFADVDLAAPGQDIVSTLPGNAYGYKNGTSMATPMVTGAISLIWSQDPDREHDKIREMILSTVDKLPSLSDLCSTGGRLNLSQAAEKTQVMCTDFGVTSLQLGVNAVISFDEVVWAGTNDGIYQSGLYDCQDTLWDHTNVLPDKYVYSLAKDGQGNIWAGTKGGLVKYDGGSWTSYTTSNSGIPGNQVEHVFADRGDTLWLAIHNHGIVRFDGTNWTMYSTLFSGYPVLHYNVITRDSADALWFGYDSGLCKLNGDTFSWYKSANSPINDYKITCLAVDSLNQLWIGTDQDGLIQYDGSQWDFFGSDDSDLADDQLKSLSIDQEGFLWVGTASGLNKFGGNNWDTYDNSIPIIGLPGNDIKSLYTSATNDVWVGTNNGLYVFSEDALMASFSTDKSICLDEWVSFQNTSIGTGFPKWYVDGNFRALANTFMTKFSTPGTYNVSLVVQNLYSSDTTVQEINVLSLPSLDLGADTTACAASITLDAGHENMQFAWKNLSDTLLGSNQLFLADSSGHYILEISNSCGITVSDTLQVTLSGDCVWPGDVNTDGQVNMLDYLSLGIAHNAAGTSRAGASTQWRSEVATDWGESFGTGHAYAANVNFKHADCDGDGTVDIAADGAVVMQNVGYSHQSLPAPIGNGIELAIEPTITTLNASDTFVIDYNINLSTSDGSPVEGVYGVAFTLDYNLPLTQQPSVVLDSVYASKMNAAIITYDENNVGTGNQVNALSQQIAVGAVGTDKTNETISSKLGKMSVIVVLEDIQEASGVQGFVNFSVTPGNLVIIDSVGATLPVNQNSSSATSNVKIVFPNPNFPVEWLDFSASPQQGEVELIWALTGQTGNEQFWVQRSQNGSQFEDLQLVQSHEDQSEYHFSDFQPHSGTSFYRILCLERDGSFSYSQIEVVQMLSPTVGFSVYPNPNRGLANISLRQTEGGITRIRLFSPLGQILRDERHELPEGNHEITLDLQGLTPGTYFLKLNSGRNQKMVKLRVVP